MSRPRSNLRMFAAVYPPPDEAAAMLAGLGELDLPPHRPTPAEQVHLTLQFIGDVPAKDLDATVESVERAASGLRRFALVPARLMTLPRRGPARLVALETDAPPTLLELQRRLATRLATKPRRNVGDQFTPHLTLCRFRAPVRGVRVDEAVAWPAFEVGRVVLMRSTLQPGGAEHREVAGFELL